MKVMHCHLVSRFKALTLLCSPNYIGFPPKCICLTVRSTVKSHSKHRERRASISVCAMLCYEINGVSAGGEKPSLRACVILAIGYRAH